MAAWHVVGLVCFAFYTLAAEFGESGCGAYGQVKRGVSGPCPNRSLRKLGMRMTLAIHRFRFAIALGDAVQAFARRP